MTLLDLRVVDRTSQKQLDHSLISGVQLFLRNQRYVTSDRCLEHFPVCLSKDVQRSDGLQLLVFVLICVDLDVFADPDASDLHFVESQGTGLV